MCVGRRITVKWISEEQNREYGRMGSPRWPRDTLYPQTLALTSPTSGGRSIGIVRSRIKPTELELVRVLFRFIWLRMGICGGLLGIRYWDFKFLKRKDISCKVLDNWFSGSIIFHELINDSKLNIISCIPLVSVLAGITIIMRCLL
jgi:hypothetical protein